MNSLRMCTLSSRFSVAKITQFTNERRVVLYAVTSQLLISLMMRLNRYLNFVLICGNSGNNAVMSAMK